MKRLFLLCLVSVVMVSICQANGEVEVWIPELEEVESYSALPGSKSCHCPESCRYGMDV